MESKGLDALLVCGNQYAGFEGAILYMSGFEIVHRYVYVLFPLQGEPTLVFPREARWIGDKAKPWVKDHVWPDVPGQWVRDIARERKWKRLGVYGMNFVMAVRDYRELSNGLLELVPFDTEFDMARAVKSEEELAEVRDAMDIILDGFWALVRAYSPGKTEAQIMAPAVERFCSRARRVKRKPSSKFPDSGSWKRTICCCTRLRSPELGDTGLSSHGPCFAAGQARPRKKWPTLIRSPWRRRGS